MRISGRFFTASIFGLAMIGILLVAGPNTADARPKYLKGFKKEYKDLVKKLKKQSKAETDKAKKKKLKVNCFVCHYGKKKKNRNDYGDAMGKALGKKKVKEADLIEKALKKIEKGKSSVKGKTFGDLIKAGKLPGTAPKKKAGSKKDAK